MIKKKIKKKAASGIAVNLKNCTRTPREKSIKEMLLDDERSNFFNGQALEGDWGTEGKGKGRIGNSREDLINRTPNLDTAESRGRIVLIG